MCETKKATGGRKGSALPASVVLEGRILVHPGLPDVFAHSRVNLEMGSADKEVGKETCQREEEGVGEGQSRGGGITLSRSLS